MFNFKKDKDGYLKWFMGNMVSGGLAGAASLCFVYSLDYVRTRLANDTKSAKKGGARQYNGMIDCYVKTFKSDGLLGLYRGFCVSCVGIVAYRGFYFGLYDTLQPLLPMDNFLVNFLLGWVVTIVSGLISYPLDTVRRRMMMTSGTGKNYKNSFECFAVCVKTEALCRCSAVPARTFSVVLLARSCCPVWTRSSRTISAPARRRTERVELKMDELKLTASKELRQ